jgi:Protein of unknown function with PCYCGC motif
MAKSSKKEQKQERPPSRKPSFGIILLIIILGGIAVFALSRNKQYEPPANQSSSPAQAQEAPEPQYSPEVQEQKPAQADPATQAEAHFHVPSYFENPDMAEPLKPVLALDSVPIFARPGYEVAQRKPRLMAQMPCFCYCEKFGHTSLHTCFETDHAIHCDICLKEALEADRMDSQGLSPQEIREFIIQNYKPRGPHNHG